MAQTDRRTQRTRQAILSGFIELMLARGYAAVAVDDIVAKANIGRSTFYTHFRSKLDVLKHSLVGPSQVLAALVGEEASQDPILRLLMHFHEQRRLNRAFFVPPVRAVWESCLAEMIEPKIATLVKRTRAVARQLADVQVSLVANWLLSKPSLDCSRVAEALARATKAMLFALLVRESSSPNTIAPED